MDILLVLGVIAGMIVAYIVSLTFDTSCETHRPTSEDYE